MVNNILYVYRWASMGGVERVLLNRASSLQKAGLKFHFDVYFLEDLGGKHSFKRYIERNALSDIIKVVDHIVYSNYDLIFTIDTPEIIPFVPNHKLFVECHTSYKKNREYLKSLPSNIRGVIAPSSFMVNDIRKELPHQLSERVYTISNDIYINPKFVDLQLPRIYSRTPVLYLGRLDKMKNVEEVIKYVSLYNSQNNKLLLILAGEIIKHEFDILRILKKYKMNNSTVYLPAIDFDKTQYLMRIVSIHNGIFMSASLNESFALSVGEAMAFGIPVLLFDNEAHRNLVRCDEQYLFADNENRIVSKIDNLLDDYSHHRIKMKEYIECIEGSFLTDWLNVIKQ